MIKVDYKFSDELNCWQVSGVSAVPMAWADMKRIRKQQAKAIQRVLRLANAYNNFAHLNARANERIADLSADALNGNAAYQKQYEQLQVAQLSWFVAYHVDGGQFDLVTDDNIVLDTGYAWLHISDGVEMRQMSPLQISTTAAQYFFSKGWRVADGAQELYHTPDCACGDELADNDILF